MSGGSGGHLAPLVAVERALRTLVPAVETRIICSDHPRDLSFLKGEGYEPITLPRLRRSLALPYTFWRAWRRAQEILSQERPDAIFSKGGAVSVPLCLAAARLSIPIVLHESDAVMGWGNRIVARFAQTICLGLPLHTTHGTRRTTHSILTGNPVRPGITEGSRSEGLKLTGLSGHKPILLIMGGSQGAQAINAAIVTHIDALLACCDIIHLTGEGKSTAIARAGYWQAPFVALAVHRHLYAASDCAVSRAGASSIAELSANGIPTILVPIEGLAGNHQVENAITAQENAGCILLLQSNLNRSLVSEVQKICSDAAARAKISKTMTSFAAPDAARQIAEIIVACVARRQKSH